MTPSDPKGPAHDGNPHEAIQSLLSSADWESRLAVAREQRRLVLEAKAAAQPDTQSRERRSEARGSWETQLDLARTARTEVLAKQAEAIQPEPVVGPVIVAPVLAAPVRPVMPVQEYRPTAAVEKRPSRVWLVVISVALIAVLAGGLLWQQGLLPSFSP